MALPELVALVDRAGTSVRISLAMSALAVRPALQVADPSNGDVLYVAALADAAGSWQWKADCVRDQPLLISTGEATIAALPVLVNQRVRRVLARELKQAGNGCACHAAALEALRLYHALCLLLFAQADYASCAAHLTLLRDLEPCPCAC